MLAGAVYLGGAIGMEMLGAATRGPDTLVLHNVFIVLEETGEMLGILLLLRALAHHLTRHPATTSA